MDFIFELFCYATAIAAVLAFSASPRHPQQPKQREVAKTLETLSKIGETLPEKEECFEAEEKAIATPVLPSTRFGSVRTTDEERALVESASEAIARHWENTPIPVVIEFPSRNTAAKAIAPEAVAVVEVTPMLEYRTRDDLRALCNAKGVQPFDRVDGKRKHWNAQRMVQELSARGYDVVKV